MSSSHECTECGAQFTVKNIHEDADDEVEFCPMCGEELQDPLDENLFDFFDEE
jgi:predicted nucleic acid-binding Zn ribbon protein